MTPSLPTELIQYIIQLTLPYNNDSNTITRYEFGIRSHILLPLTFVSSIFRELAEQELVKHLVLDQTVKLYYLARRLEHRSQFKLSTRVITMTLAHTAESEDLITLAQVLKYCSDLKSLSLQSFSTTVLMKDFCDWTKMTQLTSLESEDPYPPVRPCSGQFSAFPSVTHLSLMNKILDNLSLPQHSPVCDFINLSILPSINSLSIAPLDRRRYLIPDARLIPSSLLSQIKTLSIEITFGGTFSPTENFLSPFGSLETLVLKDVHSLEAYTRIKFPPLLRVLVISTYSFKEPASVFFTLKQWLVATNTKQQIQIIRVPSLSTYKQGYDEAVEFNNFLEDRRIQLFDGGKRFIEGENSIEEVPSATQNFAL